MLILASLFLMHSLLILKHLINYRQYTVSIDFSDPTCKDDNSWFTRVPLKALSDQVWIKYQCFCFFKLFIFILRDLRIACLLVTMEKFSEITTFWVRKNMLSFTFLIRLGFQGYRCKSGIAIFALRLYSPLNTLFKFCWIWSYRVK